jgi:hypothetical protein
MSVFEEFQDIRRYRPTDGHWNDQDDMQLRTLEGPYPRSRYRKCKAGERLWSHVHLGESEEDVLMFLGLPDYVYQGRYNEIWDVYWAYKNDGNIAFRNGTVTGIETLYRREGILDTCEFGQERWQDLRIGMTDIETVQLVGRPDKVYREEVANYRGRFNIDMSWIWDSLGIKAKIEFKKTKVVSFHYDLKNSDSGAGGFLKPCVKREKKQQTKIEHMSS